MDTSRHYTVLLVEDDQQTCHRLANAISKYDNLILVSAVFNLHDAYEALRAHIPDVLIIDLNLPDGHGSEFIRYACESFPKLEAMVISVFGDEYNVISAIEAGATGYLLKDSSTQEIGSAILQLVNGGSPISPAIARHLLKRFDNSSTQTNQDEEKSAENTASLTRREIDVLEYVAKGFSYRETADMLNMSVHTVNSHIKQIYRKLEVKSRSEAVYEAIQLGLIDVRS